MTWIASHVWLIPLLPLLAAGGIGLMPRRAAVPAMTLAIGAMSGALGLALLAFLATLTHGGEGALRVVTKFEWLRVGTAGAGVPLGFLLDPLAAVMLVMVTFVGLLIFVFSAGYMAEDDNRARFFCFLSLFAAAMLGLVISNSLLLLFGCWEVMGLASYLLIGFWFQKPSAAAAAKKAFIVTRIGDLGLFLGMLWLYREAGTLLFYDGGAGALEPTALASMTTTLVTGSLSVATCVSLLLFVGAVGKSGQVPLHVWLPDAMEGPTPVSALIHAATMVAAGVFLVARVFPLMAGGVDVPAAAGGSIALGAVATVGAVTAVFAALMAVAQNDIKRILAYSTVSQLGYMFLGLGTGGVAVGMFHLITHAFFKALLFLGAGSVIHGCHHEQDIRRMGDLRRRMPVTFAAYAIGMMALAGVPVFFSGFWSKDEILHSAWSWGPSRWLFVLGVFGAFLTAFYMTRQVAEVFFGKFRGESESAHHSEEDHHHGAAGAGHHGGVHESPRVMTMPLVLLAGSTLVLGWLGTPVWPWFESYLAGHGHTAVSWERLGEAVPLMLASTLIVAMGIGLGWLLYGRRPRASAVVPDVIEAKLPGVFAVLRDRFYVDELYEATVVRLHRAGSHLDRWMDHLVIGGLVVATGALARAAAFSVRMIDELFVNAGFDAGCGMVRWVGRGFSRLQSGGAQRYLGWMGLAAVVLMALVVWGLRHE